MVTYYGNYMILIGYCSTLLNVIFGSMGASIGNLIADNNKHHTLDVFWELFTSRIWIAGIASFTLYITIGPFISLWIGSKYILSESTLLLLLVSLFIRLSRTVIESFKDAYQLFGDVWAPIFESCLNLGGSIIFGYLWGLNGVLIGVNLSLIIIVLLWKPYYTFRYGLISPVAPYFIQYTGHLIILIGGAIISKFIMGMTNFDENNIIGIALNTLLGLLAYIAITYTILMISTKGMRNFTIRLKNIIKQKI